MSPVDRPALRRRPLDATVTAEERQMLVRLMEEAGEVVQAAAKLLRFGFYSTSPEDPRQVTNWNALEGEIADLNRTMAEVRAAERRHRG